MRIFSLFAFEFSFNAFHLITELCVCLEQFRYCVYTVNQSLSLGVLLRLVKKRLACSVQTYLWVVRASGAINHLNRFIRTFRSALDVRQDHLTVHVSLQLHWQSTFTERDFSFWGCGAAVILNLLIVLQLFGLILVDDFLLMKLLLKLKNGIFLVLVQLWQVLDMLISVSKLLF